MQNTPTSQNLNGSYVPPQRPQSAPPKKPMPKWVKIAIVAFAVLVVLGALSTCGKEPSPTTNEPASNATDNAATSPDAEAEKTAVPEKTEEELAAEAAAQAKRDATVRSGTYKVGSEIPAGQYYLEGSGYFALMSDSSGSLEAIIANDNYSGNSIVDLAEGQYFQLKGSSAYPIEYASIEERTEFSDGVYRVGIDMPAGEYKVDSKSGMGYIEVASDASHTLDSIIANEIVEGSTYQSVDDGQYVKLSGATATLV